MDSVEKIVEVIIADLSRRRPPVGIYWYEVHGGSRRDVCGELDGRHDGCLFVGLMTGAGLDNPNTVVDDVRKMLEKERTRIEEMLRDQPDIRGIGIVVLTRTRLNAVLTGSPVAMPVWMPLCGGTVVTRDLTDLQGAVGATVKEMDDDLVMLSTLLFEVEGLMLMRLAESVEADKRLVQSFLGAIVDSSKGGSSEATFLQKAEATHARKRPKEFRVSTRQGDNDLVGRMIDVIGRTTPEQLPSFGKTLVKALRLDNAGGLRMEPFLAVLFRSTQAMQESSGAARFPRDVVLAIYGASQVITASHHAADYGEYPPMIMRMVMSDLRRCLADLRDRLAVATPVPE